MVKVTSNVHRFPANLYRASIENGMFEYMFIPQSVGGFESGPVSFDVLDVPGSGTKTTTVREVLELAKTADRTQEPVNYLYASALKLASGRGKGVGLPFALHKSILVVTGTTFQDLAGDEYVAFFAYDQSVPYIKTRWILVPILTDDSWTAEDGPIKILFRHLHQYK